MRGNAQILEPTNVNIFFLVYRMLCLFPQYSPSAAHLHLLLPVPLPHTHVIYLHKTLTAHFTIVIGSRRGEKMRWVDEERQRSPQGTLSILIGGMAILLTF